MHLLLVGISHKTAPIDLRERVDFQARGVELALRTLAARRPGAADEIAVLSTCNRAELYMACDDPATAKSELVSFVSAFHDIDAAAITPHVYDVLDLDAARHLFRVAAGLDSLVVGEPQILGQVKEAHSAARQAETAGPLLNRLFHACFAVGKRVRTETNLGSGAVSVSYAAVNLAKKIFGTLDGRNVVVLGAGEMGKLTAQHMKSQGVRQVTIVSRTIAHAARTAEAIGGATGAATPILTKARVESVMRPRRGRPLFVIDIAVPRDVEAAAGEIEQVFLYNIDDLQASVRENLARRASEVARAEGIVDEELGKFGTWLRSRGVIPTVVALRQSFEATRRAEIDRLDFKLSTLPPEVREEARTRVDEITHLLVEKLLLTPTEQLKSIADSETATLYAEAIARVFNLAEASAEKDTGLGARDSGSEARQENRVEPFSRAKSRPGPGRPR